MDQPSGSNLTDSAQAPKPIHVQVAEAVMEEEFCGCPGDPVWSRHGYDPQTGRCKGCQKRNAPRYDIDWSATGPLIEKYGICLWNEWGGVGDWEAGFGASADFEGMWLDEKETGRTPLIAACNLILALGKAGKL